VDLAANATAQIGEIVGQRYRLLRVLGVGGMGAVYEAEHTLTKRRVAVKVIHRSVLERTPMMAERFVREAQAPVAIRHPAIVEIFDGGQDERGRLFLVFDLLEGITLEQALRTGTVSSDDCISVAITVLSALEAAHAKGLVHRDIKPENIFLVGGSIDSANVKLLDFGIAKRVDGDAAPATGTVMGTVIGTGDFMSPEQAAGRPVDGRTDLWALGAVLYRAYAGEAPFSGVVPILAQLAAITSNPVPPLRDRCPTVPTSLAAAIDRALEKNIDSRWATAAEMRRALEACRRSPSIVGDGPTRVAPMPDVPLRRPRTRIAPIAIAVLAVGLTVGGWLIAAEKEPAARPAPPPPPAQQPQPPPPAPPPPAAIPAPPPRSADPPPAVAKKKKKRPPARVAPQPEKVEEPKKQSPWDSPLRSY
jgi:serine/threonine protein kinase